MTAHRDVHGEGRPEGQPADADRDGRRLDGRVGRLPAAAPVRHRDRRARRDHRVDHRGHRHADAGVRVPAPRDRKPDLDAGIFAYAKAGFGDYVGFNSAFGYWASACAGNVSYWVLIMATIGAVFPAFGDGDTVLAVVVSRRSASGCSAS